jgi:hypothetical protein
MNVVESINQARQAGYTDDQILGELAKQNPQKGQMFSQAAQSGYRPADILDEVIAQNTPQKQSFLTNLANDPFKTLIAKPATRFGQLLGAPIAYGASAVTGNPQYKENYLNALSQDTQVPGLIPGSQVNIEGVKSGMEGAKQVTGEAFKSASYLAPAGATLKTATALGGLSGGLYGAGDVLEQGGTAGEALTSGAISGATGALTGFALKGAVPAASFVKDKVINRAAKFSTSQATGMSPKTIETILKNPEKVTPEAIQAFDEMAIPNRVEKALSKEIAKIKSDGIGYQRIREARTPVTIPRKEIVNVLKKFGMDFDADGKMIRSIDTVAMKAGDQAEIERFWNDYGKYENLTSNSVLNARKALDILAQYEKDPTKSDVSNQFAHKMRELYDKAAKSQVKGLDALDKKYAPQINAYNKIRRDYLNPDGSLKDNALTKIHNLTSANKSIVLARLEKLIPGIGEEINVAAALRDAAASEGIKVGTYIRGNLVGGGAGATIGGAVAGPLGALAGGALGGAFGLLVANPATAVPIIRAFAKSRKIAEPVVDKIIDQMRKGKPLSDASKKLIYAAIADFIGDKAVEKKSDQPVDAYLESLGL